MAPVDLVSTRRTPEPRVVLANETLRLDFDPRTSDTMYNYIWVRSASTGEWERLHNFGVDVRALKTGNCPPELPKGIINTVGMALDVTVEGRRAVVRYPNPLIQYRQFDDKISPLDLVDRYPDFSRKELPSLAHADGEAEFVYEIDPARPSFTISGRVISGTVPDVTCIIDALWTDNHACPTREYVEGFPEWDIADPEAVPCKDFKVENVAFAIFYRGDGNGVPFALLPVERAGGGFCNYYDNGKCDVDFRRASRNQSYVPKSPAVTGCNDAGYLTSPSPDGRLAGVRVAFFPELAYLRGGSEHALRDRIVETVKREYWDSVRSWDRAGKDLPPKITLSGRRADAI